MTPFPFLRFHVFSGPTRFIVGALKTGQGTVWVQGGCSDCSWSQLSRASSATGQALVSKPSENPAACLFSSSQRGASECAAELALRAGCPYPSSSPPWWWVCEEFRTGYEQVNTPAEEQGMWRVRFLVIFVF